MRVSGKRPPVSRTGTPRSRKPKKEKREICIAYQWSGSSTLHSVSISHAFLFRLFLLLPLTLLLWIFYLLLDAGSTSGISASQREAGGGEFREWQATFENQFDTTETLIDRMYEIHQNLREGQRGAELESMLSSFRRMEMEGQGRGWLPARVHGRRLFLLGHLVEVNFAFSKMYAEVLSGLPHRSPIPSRRLAINSAYGLRRKPGTVRGSMQFHRGIDLRARVGDSVHSTAAGEVIIVERNSRGYGNWVRIRHHSGYDTIYAHLSRIVVRSGQFVPVGEILGYAGESGNATGPHLHYEIRREGKHVNPIDFLPFPGH